LFFGSRIVFASLCCVFVKLVANVVSLIRRDMIVVDVFGVHTF
jgi:hypothetical protein